MQMIDVLKRLAELDAANPAVDTGAKVVQPTQNISVNESLEECGMMGGMSQPHTPASINMTAASGEELSAMLKDIMTLAGHAGHDDGMDMDGDMGMPDGDGVAVPSMEPDATSSMRSMIDKLNGPDMDDDGGDGKPEEEGVIGGALGGLAGAALGGPLGAMTGYAAGSKAGDDLSSEEEPKEWSNTPDDPRNVPDFDANKMSNQDPAGQPGVGDRMDGDRPKAFATTEDRLMWEYKQFVAEDIKKVIENAGQLGPIEGNLPVMTYFNRGTQEFGGNEAPVQKAILDWVKKAAGLPPDAPLEFDQADITYNGDIVVRSVLDYQEGITFNDVVEYIKDFLGQQTGEMRQGVAETAELKKLAGI